MFLLNSQISLDTVGSSRIYNRNATYETDHFCGTSLSPHPPTFKLQVQVQSFTSYEVTKIFLSSAPLNLFDQATSSAKVP